MITQLTSESQAMVLQGHPLPSPSQILHELPTSLSQKTFIEKTRQEIRNILDGQDPRLLLIVGPCSIHDVETAKQYASQLHKLSQSLSDSFLIVMRAHLEKPRTTTGWKGLLYDPLLDGSHEIETGLRWSRQLLLDLAHLEMPIATEFLDPSIASYLGDLVSWGCIGARTTSSQIHRQLASGLAMPIAFKNNTDGNVETAIHSVLSASEPHAYIGINISGQISTMHSKGNPHAHIVLRGGKNQTNYDPYSISQAIEQLERASLPLRLLIDCAHGNSLRKYEEQCRVFQSVINQVVEGNDKIRGMILESYLLAGNQIMTDDPTQLDGALSITDPCLDWPATETLLKWGAEMLRTENRTSCLISL